MSKKIVSIIFLLLLFLRFLGLKLLPIKPSFWDYPLLILLITLVIGSIKLKGIYAKLIVSYVGFVILSCIFSAFYHSQNIVIVFFHTYHYIPMLIFFYFMKEKITFKEAERILIIISLTCCLCYIIQWLIYPTILFENAESKWTVSEDEYRARIPGSICCYCLFLYGFNKYLHEKRLINLVYSLLGFLPIIIMGFRSLVALSVASFFLMIPFVLKSTRKTLFYSFVGVGLAFVALQTPIVQSKLKEMDKRNQNQQTFANEDYVRYLSFDYYWNLPFHTPIEHVVGGGLPADTSSKYSKIISKGQLYHFYWNDLGLIGLSMFIGIPAVMMLVLMCLVGIWKCKDPKLQYIRFTLFIELSASIFTSAELYRKGNLLMLALFLYIDYRFRRELKMKEVQQN